MIKSVPTDKIILSNKPSYPYIGQGKFYYVLFTAPRKGFIIGYVAESESSDPPSLEIGYQTNTFFENDYVPMKGSISLSNE